MRRSRSFFPFGRVGDGKERQGIRVLAIGGKYATRTAPNLPPILLGSGGLCFIEQTVNLALDPFAWHCPRTLVSRGDP